MILATSYLKNGWLYSVTDWNFGTWDTQVRHTCTWITFDLAVFKVILGSFWVHLSYMYMVYLLYWDLVKRIHLLQYVLTKLGHFFLSSPVTLWAYFCSRFLRYIQIFKITIFGHETWTPAKVPEVEYTTLNLSTDTYTYMYQLINLWKLLFKIVTKHSSINLLTTNIKLSKCL